MINSAPFQANQLNTCKQKALLLHFKIYLLNELMDGIDVVTRDGNLYIAY